MNFTNKQYSDKFLWLLLANLFTIIIPLAVMFYFMSLKDESAGLVMILVWPALLGGVAVAIFNVYFSLRALIDRAAISIRTRIVCALVLILSVGYLGWWGLILFRAISPQVGGL